MIGKIQKPIFPSEGEWTELPGVIGLGMTTKYDKAKGMITALCYRFKIWTGAKKYMSLEIPGVHPEIFKKLMMAFAHAKKSLDDSGFESFGMDKYICECSNTTFKLATDHRNEGMILLHLVCAECGVVKDISCKMIPNLSLLEEGQGEEREDEKQSSENPPA